MFLCLIIFYSPFVHICVLPAFPCIVLSQDRKSKSILLFFSFSKIAPPYHIITLYMKAREKREHKPEKMKVVLGSRRIACISLFYVTIQYTTITRYRTNRVLLFVLFFWKKKTQQLFIFIYLLYFFSTTTTTTGLVHSLFQTQLNQLVLQLFVILIRWCDDVKRIERRTKKQLKYY